MKKYISHEKLNKKARRELDNRQRLTWDGICPVTRKVESKKLYNRKKARIGFDDSCYEPFLMFFYRSVQSKGTVSVISKQENHPIASSCASSPDTLDNPHVIPYNFHKEGGVLVARKYA